MKRSLLVIVLATLLLGAMAAPSAARPGEIHAAATGFAVDLIDPGESWIAGDVWHVRGFTMLYRVVGTDENSEYTTGYNLSVVDWNWNLKNGNSHVWGSYTYTLDAFDGGYAGKFTIPVGPNPDAVPGPDFDPTDLTSWPCVAWTKSTATGKGFGELEGAQLRGDLWSDTCSAVYTLDATIFHPGG